MAVKLADTLAPMGDFEIADAKDISVEIEGEKKMLQTAIDNGEIGGGGDSAWKGTVAEFEALDKSTLKDGQQIIMTDDYDSNGDIYSTEEIVVGRWIDGKPIYRRVYTANTTDGCFNTEVISDIDTLVSASGTVHANNESWVRVSPHAFGISSALYSSYISLLETKKVTLECTVNGSRNNYYKGVVTLVIEYTKTTD